MAIKFKKEEYSGKKPNIWPGTSKPLPGGFKPVQNIAVGTLVPEATPLYVDFDARTAAICKSATVLDGGTTSKVNVAKGTLFQVGDKVLKVGGTVLGEVASVDTTNAAYDIINLKAAYTGLVKGDNIVEGVEKDGTVKAAYTPNAVTPVEKKFDGKGIDVLDAAYEAIVLYRNLPFPIVADWKQGYCLKDNPGIKFITQ